MHDINDIRKDPDAFDAGLAKRGVSACANQMLTLDDKRRVAIAEAQDLQTRRNEASKKIGQAKGRDDEVEAQRLMDEVAGLKGDLQEAEEAERAANAELAEALAALPNLPLEGVPIGEDEEANVEIRRHGEPRKARPSILKSVKRSA